MKCMHVVVADSSCSQIEIQYRSVAVEPVSDCSYDSFGLGWSGPNGFDITPGRCGCFGDGCSGSFNYDNFDDYFAQYFEDQTDVMLEDLLGPDNMSVDSNTFTFYFQSDLLTANGHVIIDWQCLTPTTTTPITTTSTRK